MPDLYLAGASFLAGVLMFLAPCTLPLVPAYLAYISQGGRSGGKNLGVFRTAVWFTVGFGTVFTLFGLLFGLFGDSIGPYQRQLSFIAGVIVLCFSVALLTVGRVPLKLFSLPIMPRLSTFNRGTRSGAMLLGASIAVGWSPCVGPVLASVLLLAAAKATAAEGSLLLAIFSVGFAVPFLVTAYFYERLVISTQELKVLNEVVRYIGAALLAFVGYLLLFDSLGMLAGAGYAFFDFFGLTNILNYY